MNRPSVACMTALILVSLAQVPAHACGESMFRVGFGVNLPPARVKNPISIAIFKASDIDPDVFFDDANTSSKLVKVGHRVSLVSTGSVADDSPQSFDVVIVRVDEIDSAREALGARATGATFLPVYENPGSVKDKQSLSLPASASLRQILAVLQLATVVATSS